MPSARGLLFSLSLFVALSACGGAAFESGAETTAAPAAREPLPELTSLQRDLNASEAQLGAHLEGRRAESPVVRQQKADGAAPADQAPQSEGAPAPQGADDAAAKAACDLVCRALSSMRRSAEGICMLTAAHDPRCEGARGRAESAARRVAGAGCPCPP